MPASVTTTTMVNDPTIATNGIVCNSSCNDPDCDVNDVNDANDPSLDSNSNDNASPCALSEKCVQACSAYGRICPCTARAAGKAAHDKIESILSNSAVFQTKPDLHTIDAEDITIGRKLGEGGFAMVNTCTIKNDGGEDAFAIKYLKLKTMMERKCFQHGAADLATEAFFLSSIDHPNFIRLKGVTAGSVETNVACAKECGFFIVVERLQGTLDERIHKWRRQAESEHTNIFARMSHSYKEKQRFKLLERLLVAVDVARGMEYLHSRNIIFRDLKPDNVGFDAMGTVKLFDLGLCREQKVSDLDQDTGMYKMTGHTGSRRYMAPEVAKAEPYNQTVDAYSFGILLWEMCALEKPFQGYSGRRHMHQVVLGGERPKMDHSHVANWPINLQWLIKSCWSELPEHRPSFTTIKASLQEIIHETTHATISSPIKSPRRARTVGIKEAFKISPPPLADEKIVPPPGGFASIQKPGRSGGRHWSLGFNRDH